MDVIEKPTDLKMTKDGLQPRAIHISRAVVIDVLKKDYINRVPFTFSEQALRSVKVRTDDVDIQKAHIVYNILTAMSTPVCTERMMRQIVVSYSALSDMDKGLLQHQLHREAGVLSIRIDRAAGDWLVNYFIASCFGNRADSLKVKAKKKKITLNASRNEVGLDMLIQEQTELARVAVDAKRSSCYNNSKSSDNVSVKDEDEDGERTLDFKANPKEDDREAFCPTGYKSSPSPTTGS